MTRYALSSIEDSGRKDAPWLVVIKGPAVVTYYASGTEQAVKEGATKVVARLNAYAWGGRPISSKES